MDLKERVNKRFTAVCSDNYGREGFGKLVVFKGKFSREFYGQKLNWMIDTFAPPFYNNPNADAWESQTDGWF